MVRSALKTIQLREPDLSAIDWDEIRGRKRRRDFSLAIAQSLTWFVRP